MLDIARVYLGAVNNMFPATQPLALPYIFRDEAHMRARAAMAPSAKSILHTFERRGLIGLAFYDSGFRSMYNARHPIHDAGRHARPQGARAARRTSSSDMLDAMGANPTPIPFGEVFTGLQTHLIDAAENNWATFQSTRQYEVARYWSQTDHCGAPEALLMSKARFDALSRADKDLVPGQGARVRAGHARAVGRQSRQRRARPCSTPAFNTMKPTLKRSARAVEPMKRRYLRDRRRSQTTVQAHRSARIRSAASGAWGGRAR